MTKEFQKSALPTLFHFARVKAAFQQHVKKIMNSGFLKIDHLVLRLYKKVGIFVFSQVQSGFSTA